MRPPVTAIFPVAPDNTAQLGTLMNALTGYYYENVSIIFATIDSTLCYEMKTASAKIGIPSTTVLLEYNRPLGMLLNVATMLSKTDLVAVMDIMNIRQFKTGWLYNMVNEFEGKNPCDLYVPMLQHIGEPGLKHPFQFVYRRWIFDCLNGFNEQYDNQYMIMYDFVVRAMIKAGANVRKYGKEPESTPRLIEWSPEDKDYVSRRITQYKLATFYNEGEKRGLRA